MNGDPNVTDAETAPTTRGRTGVAIGILIVTLLVLAFYFYWRTTGMQERGRRPSAPREISSLPDAKGLRVG
jgi:ABC-type transporter Mla subunit MlaD